MDVKVKIINDLNPNTVLLGVNHQNNQIKQIIAYIKNQDQKIVGKTNHKQYLIRLSDCFSFFSSQKKVYANTIELDKPILVNKRLYVLQKELPKQFVRISNTEIINLNHVQKFEVSKGGIILIHFNNHCQTSSSRRYLKVIKERLF